MESLERFSQNQRVIEDFVSQSLASIPTELGRLFYVAALRDASEGCYRHPALEKAYSGPSVHQALLYCHEELLEKILETTLEHQERDLRAYLAGTGVPADKVAARWLEGEAFRSLVPFSAPPYLRDLFFSNLRVILGLIVAENATLQTVA